MGVKISELVEATEITEDDYLVIDNGTATKKVSGSKVLKQPIEEPSEKILVGIDESNNEIQFKLGEDFELEGSSSPYTIKVIKEHPIIRNNITVSGTPSALSTYESWDTEEKYGYALNVTINGLTLNSMIEDIVMTDVLHNEAAYVAKTSADTLTLYFENDKEVSGSILTLITSEVVNA